MQIISESNSWGTLISRNIFLKQDADLSPGKCFNMIYNIFSEEISKPGESAATIVAQHEHSSFTLVSW